VGPCRRRSRCRRRPCNDRTRWWLIERQKGVRISENDRIARRTHLSSLVLMYCARSVSEFLLLSLYGALSRLSSDAAEFGAKKC
jgi:hypothetical protein